jgi:hypothetical protein
LAVAGKDLGLELQTAYRGKGLEEVIHPSCCRDRIVILIRHRFAGATKCAILFDGIKKTAYSNRWPPEIISFNRAADFSVSPE